MKRLNSKKKVEYTGENIDKNTLFELYTGILQKNANKINKKAEEIEKIAIYEKITIKDKVNQIVNYYVGVSDEDKTKIRNSLINLTKVAISHKKAEQSENLFTQGSLIVNNDYIYLWLLTSNVTVVAKETENHI